jgi:hypothetical protein
MFQQQRQQHGPPMSMMHEGGPSFTPWSDGTAAVAAQLNGVHLNGGMSVPTTTSPAAMAAVVAAANANAVANANAPPSYDRRSPAMNGFDGLSGPAGSGNGGMGGPPMPGMLHRSAGPGGHPQHPHAVHAPHPGHPHHMAHHGPPHHGLGGAGMNGVGGGFDALMQSMPGGASPPRMRRRRHGRDANRYRIRHEQVTRQAVDLLTAIAPTKDEVARRQKLALELEDLIRTEWSAAAIELYGSSASCYALRGATLDASLCIDEQTMSELDMADDANVGSSQGDIMVNGLVDGWPSQMGDGHIRSLASEESTPQHSDTEGATNGGGSGSQSTGLQSPTAGLNGLSGTNGQGVKPRRKRKGESGNRGQQAVIVRLGELLVANNMLDVVPLPLARVPIVKFRHPEHNLCCDVGVNKALAVANTRLLQAYGEIDPRVVDLALIVKFWAKRRNVNSPYRGTLSSYAYVVLVVFFLQTRTTPVLPPLQQICAPDAREEMAATIGEHNVYFCKDREYLTRMGYGKGANPNVESIGQLVVEFFRYYAHEFNYREDVVSIRLGRCLSKVGA